MHPIFHGLPPVEPLSRRAVAGRRECGFLPVTVGLIIATGVVMAEAADTAWRAAALTAAATALMLQSKFDPLLILFAGGVPGGPGLLQPFFPRRSDGLPALPRGHLSN